MTKKKLSNLNIAMLVGAITLMVGSATISYFLVRQNEPIIAELKMKVIDKQELIRDIWSDTTQGQSNANAAIILNLLESHENAATKEAKKHFLKNFPAVTEDSTVQEIIKSISNQNAKNEDLINDAYLQQIHLQRQISDIESKNKKYADIAFFLQLFGLILVIIRKDLPH